MPFVSFVRGVRNPSTTFLFIVDSPKDFGASSKRSLGYIFLTSTHGMRCLFKIGGASWPARLRLTGERSLPLFSSPLGKFGTSGMLGFFATSMHHHRWFLGT
jgi:hypothetical protein